MNEFRTGTSMSGILWKCNMFSIYIIKDKTFRSAANEPG